MRNHLFCFWWKLQGSAEGILVDSGRAAHQEEGLPEILETLEEDSARLTNEEDCTAATAVQALNGGTEDQPVGEDPFRKEGVDAEPIYSLSSDPASGEVNASDLGMRGLVTSIKYGYNAVIETLQGIRKRVFFSLGDLIYTPLMKA